MAINKTINILNPKIWSYKNYYRAISSFTLLLILLTAAAVVGGAYYGAHKALEKIDTLPLVAVPLKGHLFNMACFSFFCMLFLSSMISSMSTLFTSRDLSLLFSMPLSHTHIFIAKFIETSFFSVTSAYIIFAAFLLAFNNSYPAGSFFSFIAALAAATPFFYIMPAALGCLASLIISKIFPVNRSRKVIYYLLIFLFIFLIVMFRALEPEKLLSVEKLEVFANYLMSSSAPKFENFPSSWISSAVESIFKNTYDAFFLLNLAAAYISAFISMVLCLGAARLSYHESYLKYQQEQESKNGIEAKVFGYIFDPVLNIINILYLKFLRALPSGLASILDKDVKTFLRTRTLIVQSFMMIVVTAFYLYNITLMPVATKTLPADIIDMFGFANIGVISLIVISYAIRFVFPVFSLEGRAFYIIKTSPLDLAKYLRLKFYTSLIPMMIFALILCALSNYFMSIKRTLLLLSFFDTVILTYFICHFNLYIGIIFPVLDASVSEIPASFGGFVTMIICAAYAALLLAFQAVLFYFEFFMRYNAGLASFNIWEYLILLITFSGLAAFTVIGYILPKRLAADKMVNFYEEIKI
jgi:ABC-2 type transport system permease protein